MVTGTRTHGTPESTASERSVPEISVCEGGPGRTVFLESGNTDGWLSSELTVEVRR
jgi:hypothetical protein